jgi:hypothetical protein
VDLVTGQHVNLAQIPTLVVCWRGRGGGVDLGAGEGGTGSHVAMLRACGVRLGIGPRLWRVRTGRALLFGATFALLIGIRSPSPISSAVLAPCPNCD